MAFSAFRGQNRRSSSTSSSSSPTLEARHKNLFDDINNYLAFSLEKIVPARREHQLKRAGLLMDKLDMYGDDDDMVEQLSAELVKKIRDYRNRLEIRANKLATGSNSASASSSSTISTGSQVQEEELPRFTGAAAAFPVFLTAVQDLIISDDSLPIRAKYRKLFFALNSDDQHYLAQNVNPSRPSIDEAILLLRKRYRACLLACGYIDVDDEVDSENGSDQDNAFVPLTDDESCGQ